MAAFATIAASDGTVEPIQNPRHLGAAQRRLARAQRQLARKRKGARTRLARSVHDAGWGLFLRLLAEKAAQHGRCLVKVGRWEPTSQTCSACGHRDGPKPLSVRTWTCPACGVVLDRDANAARNILSILVAAGPAETKNACGGSIRPGAILAPAGEAGTHRGVA